MIENGVLGHADLLCFLPNGIKDRYRGIGVDLNFSEGGLIPNQDEPHDNYSRIAA